MGGQKCLIFVYDEKRAVSGRLLCVSFVLLAAETACHMRHSLRHRALHPLSTPPLILLPLPISLTTQKRSNDELTAALASAPEDMDFQHALKENAAVIQKKENLLEELKKELRAHKSMLVTALGAAEARQLPAAIAIENEEAAAATAAADTQAAAAAARAARAAQASASNQATPDQQQPEEEEEKEGGFYL